MKKSVVVPDPDDIAQSAVPDTILNIADIKASVLKEMGIKVFQPVQRFYLKTQWPALDDAIGTPRGIPYGKIIELSGPESHGKSVIQKLIMGEAQRDGAVAIHGDIEDSNDEPWNEVLGVDNDAMILVTPKMIYEPLSKSQKEENAEAKADWLDVVSEKGAKWKALNPFVVPNKLEAGEKRAQSAEELFQEIRLIATKLHKAGVEKMVIGIDSIANLSTEMQIEAAEHQNMRTNADISMFLSGVLKQWQIMAANFNALVVLTNQIREKPGVMFGDPTYEPGGRALRHNCHSRNRVHRKGPGKLYNNGKLVGIHGILINRKNKTGEGSLESQGAEYKIRWEKDKPLSQRVTFTKFVKREKTFGAVADDSNE